MSTPAGHVRRAGEGLPTDPEGGGAGSSPAADVNPAAASSV